MKIVGSIDILGNPTEFVEQIGEGIRDFFYTPFHALFTGKGLKTYCKLQATGAVSLVRNVVGAFYQAVDSIINAIMRSLAQFTADKPYLKKRNDLKNKEFRNVKDGIGNGVGNMVAMLWDAASGIIVKPVQAVSDHGVKGLPLGIYQGILGAAIKPVVATYDLIDCLIQVSDPSLKFSLLNSENTGLHWASHVSRGSTEVPLETSATVREAESADSI